MPSGFECNNPTKEKKVDILFALSKQFYIFAVRFRILNKQITSYMYAIVEIAGQQFKVQKDQKLYVHRLKAEVGAKLDFDKVLLADKDGKITLGAPAIEGAKVTAEVLAHVKGDKVIVFRKKRRKGYRKKNGHRQAFTSITIKSIKA
jgi:large subunit ribosomal protein L21